MTIAVHPFDVGRIADQRRVFNDEVEDDPWIVFHGTSGFNAERIETEGFSPQVALAKQDLEPIAAVFKEMRWSGLNWGGIGVLDPYSLGYDAKRRTTFFGESSVQSLLYACRDWAGGEKLRAVRKAFAELEAYLHDPSIRERHVTALANKFRSLSRKNAHPTELDKVRPATINLDWLQTRIAALDPIRQVAERSLEEHEHGVVYAVRMTTDDVGSLSLNESMGVESDRTVPASRIVGRVNVPANFHAPNRSPIDRSPNGLLAVLSRR